MSSMGSAMSPRDDDNPYRSPAACDQPSRPRFQPSRYDSWLCWIMRGCDLGSGRARQSGALVLQDHLLWSVAGWMLVVVGLLSGVVVPFLGPHSPDFTMTWDAVFAVAFWLAAGGLVLFARERVVLTSDSIRQVGPFMRRRQMPWTSVVSVTFTRVGLVRLISVDGGQIQIPADLVGIVHLVEVLERCLPHDVLQDCAADLDNYRRFLGVGSHKSLNTPQRDN